MKKNKKNQKRKNIQSQLQHNIEEIIPKTKKKNILHIVMFKEITLIN